MLRFLPSLSSPLPFFHFLLLSFLSLQGNWGHFESVRKEVQQRHGVACGFGLGEDRACFLENKRPAAEGRGQGGK